MRAADEVAAVRDAIVLSGRALSIVQAAVSEFMRLRAVHKPDRQLAPEAAAVLHQLTRPRQMSRDELPTAPLADAPSTVNTRQAADILGITCDGVRQRLRRGTLTGHRTPDGWQIPTHQLGA
ncbi:hypothetical protein GS966_02510 [Rhodococcus hoagii]|nr:hypothetical protein [Prescottella equi]NKZ88800.1 hypothetical protein [Prescottella equi]